MINFHAHEDKLLWCKVLCLLKVLLMLNATAAVAEIPPMSSPTEGFLTVHHSPSIVLSAVPSSWSTKECKTYVVVIIIINENA